MRMVAHLIAAFPSPVRIMALSKTSIDELRGV